jgi:beta-glucosidase
VIIMRRHLSPLLLCYLLAVAACGSLRGPADASSRRDAAGPEVQRAASDGSAPREAGADLADAAAPDAGDAGADQALVADGADAAAGDTGGEWRVTWDAGGEPGRDPSWADERVQALIAQMSFAEKIAQLSHDAPAISRLGLAKYNYWNEGLHGVLTDHATSFPQAIALASAWDPALLERVASAIADEARGFNVKSGKGLTYWSPVINMLRDPRWGRFDESYSEDPYLMARLGVAFVRGLQGSDPKYLKAVATPKHYAGNNSEYNRHDGSSEIDEQLLHEYYLPAFAATVAEAGAFSVMAAYNRLNGVPASANSLLLQDILRDGWGFQGYVVSDCDAVDDISRNHRFAATAAEAAAKALQAGTDLNCGSTYPSELGNALDQGLIAESDVDRALARVLRARFLLGEFDPAEQVPYRSIGEDAIESDEHAALALEAARADIVLLKNDGILPLDGTALHSLALIGPHADDAELGGYSGNPSRRVSALDAFRARFPESTGVTIAFERGCDVTGDKKADWIDRAAEVARDADLALVFVGTNPSVLCEGMDRPDWSLPGAQGELIEAVYAANPRTIVVLVTAGPLAVDWAQAHVPAILTTFYNGQEQGTAIADVLLGEANPGGKLTTTWYAGDASLPPIGDYDLRKGRTYLYYQGAPLYPFGHGLSYTSFAYRDLRIRPAVMGPEETTAVRVDVTNSGARAGDEVVQLYVRDAFASVPRPLKALRGFSRIHLEPGETKTVTFPLAAKDMAYWDSKEHGWNLGAGVFDLAVGSSSADIRAQTTLTVQ